MIKLILWKCIAALHLSETILWILGVHLQVVQSSPAVARDSTELRRICRLSVAWTISIHNLACVMVQRSETFTTSAPSSYSSSKTFKVPSGCKISRDVEYTALKSFSGLSGLWAVSRVTELRSIKQSTLRRYPQQQGQYVRG